MAEHLDDVASAAPGSRPSDGAGPATVTVYWRPRCFFCRRLLRGLAAAGVDVRLRNIWDDDVARNFVREHNFGNETVPTVAVGDEVYVNPDLRTVLDALGTGSAAGAGSTPGPGSRSGRS